MVMFNSYVKLPEGMSKGRFTENDGVTRTKDPGFQLQVFLSSNWDAGPKVGSSVFLGSCGDKFDDVQWCLFICNSFMCRWCATRVYRNVHQYMWNTTVCLIPVEVFNCHLTSCCIVIEVGQNLWYHTWGHASTNIWVNYNELTTSEPWKS